MTAAFELPDEERARSRKRSKFIIVDDGPMTEFEKMRASRLREEKAKRAEDYSNKTFTAQGARTVATVPADECAIVGHRWLPERMITKWCRVCKRWESV
jgi:hypothetical protein